MRLAEIAEARVRLGSAVQPLPQGDFSDSVGVGFSLHEKEASGRVVKRLIARPALRLGRGRVRDKLGFDLPFACDDVGVGDRFVEDAAWAYLLGHLPPIRTLSVLVPGCYMAGEDVQRWLRRGVARLDGFDVYALERHWQTILPKLRERWRVPIEFCQGSIEDIPFEASSFDVLTSAAVLEHVRNLSGMVDETARVLKPGGYALHAIGPLYYCFGADHCIAAYGLEAGYDHLLLEEPDYRRRIADRDFFEKATGNPDLAFWAVNDQFSFATATDYIESFKRRFSIDYLGVVISAEGIEYRQRFTDNWKRIVDGGISEADLLVKGLVAVVRKPSDRNEIA
jgi:SAM-dependent methyltransferase